MEDPSRSTPEPAPAPTTRRRFLKAGLLGTAAGSLWACDPCTGSVGPAVQTQKRVRWRLASSFPSSLDTIYGAAEVLAQRLAEMTEGNFQIRVYEAGELVPGLQVLDAVQAGGAEVGQTGGYYYTGKNPALAFDTCVPFGLTPRGQTAWLREGGGGEWMRRLYSDFGVVPFQAGNTGVQMGGWFKRQVNTLADLRGFKMRIPGMGGKVMNELGVAVQVLAGGDIYPALERGAIDATEWVGPYDDEKLGFYKIARHYYYPGWWEPGPSLSFLVNQKAWDELPSGYQAAFRAASAEASMAMQTRYDDKNPAAFERLLADGVQLEPFSEEIMRGAQEASESLLSDLASGDATFGKLLQEWRAYRKSSFAWFGSAERSYGNFVMKG
ncbi:MAG: TRAP transporter substrate-binding protein DctP [Planctomycetes bacterium]|nr:TRAP transporter substrate-binding protein DctP [Planctomycetota bacterium]HPF13949.1 TRAP transporter substrate-binding protein DctP [Planctomycetota bacterium]HRV80054.1 TRAP transporter substrate-binding protein DctP [Planctomycetota bacterium]